MKKRQYSIYLAPAIILTLVFYIFPLLYLCYVSLFQWDGLGPMKFVSTQNFQKVLADRVFQSAFKNTLIWILSALFLHIPLGIVLALMLSRKPKGWKLMRIMYFVPNVISTTAIAFLWYFIFHVDVGLINNVLKAVGLGNLAHPWLNSLDTALISSQIPFILYVGLTMVIFLTQLSTIPESLYEAAEVDGANGLKRDFYISLPLMKPAIATNILLNTAFCLRNFEYPFLMTGGGPANKTTNLSLYIYRQMINANKYGVSMAAGVITVIMGFCIMYSVSLIGKERKGKTYD
ncbi:MAG TPA: sugar ABC transporter permease [Clostridiales bacterium]|nr:sugar ABC transporter permease [Clostridiales bacterium]